MTSDERREMANSLRVRAVGVDFAYHTIKYAQNSFWMEHTLREIVDAMGCAENPHPAQWLVRLADLIDPTCYVVGTISQDWSDGSTVYAHELSCGHTCYTSLPEPPAYCDECGARVVTDNDQ